MTPNCPLCLGSFDSDPRVGMFVPCIGRYERPACRNASRRSRTRSKMTTDTQVRAFQRAQRLLVDGEVGEDTYGALAPHYDARARKLLKEVKDAKPDTIRRQIAAAAHCGYINRDKIHYTQEAGTRMEGITKQRRPPEFPNWADCSSFAIWCYWAAGAPDPNGTGYQRRLVRIAGAAGARDEGTRRGRHRLLRDEPLGDQPRDGLRRQRPSHQSRAGERSDVVSLGLQQGQQRPASS